MICTLFRLICTQVYDRSLFPVVKGTRETVYDVLLQQPSGEVRENYSWHVGDLIEESTDYLWFRFGRTSSTILPQYDPEKKHFSDEATDKAPYTHVFVDLHYQVAAIVHNTQLLANVSAIANMLEIVLNNGLVTANSPYKIEVREIFDPETIIDFIHAAYKVQSIKFEVGRKNNWDADEHVQEPNENLLQITDGEKTTTEIEGDSLAKDPLVKIARAISAKGRPVTVKAMRRPGAKAIKKYSKSTSKEIVLDKITITDKPEIVFNTMRYEYENLRNG